MRLLHTASSALQEHIDARSLQQWRLGGLQVQRKHARLFGGCLQGMLAWQSTLRSERSSNLRRRNLESL
jgi:hypothetical protein